MDSDVKLHIIILHLGPYSRKKLKVKNTHFLKFFLIMRFHWLMGNPSANENA